MSITKRHFLSEICFATNNYLKRIEKKLLESSKNSSKNIWIMIVSIKYIKNSNLLFLDLENGFHQMKVTWISFKIIIVPYVHLLQKNYYILTNKKFICFRPLKTLLDKNCVFKFCVSNLIYMDDNFVIGEACETWMAVTNNIFVCKKRWKKSSNDHPVSPQNI